MFYAKLLKRQFSQNVSMCKILWACTENWTLQEFGALLELVPHFLFIYSYGICTFVYFVIFSLSLSIYFKSEVPILKVSQEFRLYY